MGQFADLLLLICHPATRGLRHVGHTGSRASAECMSAAQHRRHSKWLQAKCRVRAAWPQQGTAQRWPSAAITFFSVPAPAEAVLMYTLPSPRRPLSVSPLVASAVRISFGMSTPKLPGCSLRKDRSTFVHELVCCSHDRPAFVLAEPLVFFRAAFFMR